MMSRSISSFSAQSFHLASAVGPIAMTMDKGGDEDGLAHMHLDSVSISNSANQSTAAAISSSLASSLTDEGEADASSDGQSEGGEADIGSGSGNAPSFLLADGTPGIVGLSDGDDDGDDGDDGGDDGGDGDAGGGY